MLILVVAAIGVALVVMFLGAVRSPWFFLGYLLLIPNIVTIASELRRRPDAAADSDVAD